MSDTSIRGRRLAVPVAIAVVAAMVLVFTLFPSDDGKSAVPGAGSTNTATAVEDDPSWATRRTPNDPYAKGKIDAPVVMVVYSEFQCPFCGKFARDTEPELEKRFVDTGKLRIEWRDFPYLGQESLTAAMAGRAAAKQGKFWQFHEVMYAKPFPPNSGKLTHTYLTGVARKLGLDTTRFAADLKDKSIQDKVRKDFTEGQNKGISGTPTFLINGELVVGAQPTSVFVQAIEDAANGS